MNELVYPRERTLGMITLILGSLVWLAIIIGTFGIALIWLALGFVLELFIYSVFITHIKGNGVELSEAQFPDLYAQFIACCNRLQIQQRPQVYILNGNGLLNAFATKFCGSQYVVLMSNIVDAMNKHTDGVHFYLGHELGHLRMKHLGIGHLLRLPVLWLPLLGAAYSRARESTCDRHGLACSTSPENAARALAALSAGAERWKELDIASYRNQANQSSGFWMSFNELVAGYPWLTKRVVRVMDTQAHMPRRNGFAYFLALFFPYAGRLGAGIGFLIMIYIIGMLAASGIPMYQDYTIKNKLNAAITDSQNARTTLGRYYAANRKIPKSLDELGIPSQLSGGAQLSLDTNDMELSVRTQQGTLIFEPSLDAQKNVIWVCTYGSPLKPTQVPSTCRGAE